MGEVPILAVEKGKGIVVDLEIEAMKGTTSLFLDIKLCPNQEARRAIKTSFSSDHTRGSVTRP